MITLLLLTTVNAAEDAFHREALIQANRGFREKSIQQKREVLNSLQAIGIPEGNKTLQDMQLILRDQEEAAREAGRGRAAPAQALDPIVLESARFALDEARTSFEGGNMERAMRKANQVLDIDNIPQELETQARALIAQIEQRQGGRAGHAAAAAEPSRQRPAVPEQVVPARRVDPAVRCHGGVCPAYQPCPLSEEDIEARLELMRRRQERMLERMSVEELTAWTDLENAREAYREARWKPEERERLLDAARRRAQRAIGSLEGSEDKGRTAEYTRFAAQALIDLIENPPMPRRQGGPQVFLKTLSGKTITLELPGHLTVREVKQLIFEKEGIPPEGQRLIYLGRQVDDNARVSDYNERYYPNLDRSHLIERRHMPDPAAQAAQEGAALEAVPDYGRYDLSPEKIAQIRESFAEYNRSGNRPDPRRHGFEFTSAEANLAGTCLMRRLPGDEAAYFAAFTQVFTPQRAHAILRFHLDLEGEPVDDEEPSAAAPAAAAAPSGDAPDPRADEMRAQEVRHE